MTHGITGVQDRPSVQEKRYYCRRAALSSKVERCLAGLSTKSAARPSDKNKREAGIKAVHRSATHVVNCVHVRAWVQKWVQQECHHFRPVKNGRQVERRIVTLSDASGAKREVTTARLVTYIHVQ